MCTDFDCEMFLEDNQLSSFIIEQLFHCLSSYFFVIIIILFNIFYHSPWIHDAVC